jgi:flavin reductase (DIM6/NTAB) family NADH-FMN oxidoreductase RutF
MDSQDTPHGLTVSSFTSVSLDPPLVLICLGHEVTSIELFRSSSFFGLSILKEDQRHLSQHFARKGHDRFNGLPWERGATGVPLLKNVLATMECNVENRVTSGDHDIFIAKLVRTRVNDGEPLIYFASGYRKLGD